MCVNGEKRMYLDGVGVVGSDVSGDDVSTLSDVSE